MPRCFYSNSGNFSLFSRKKISRVFSFVSFFFLLLLLSRSGWIYLLRMRLLGRKRKGWDENLCELARVWGWMDEFAKKWSGIILFSFFFSSPIGKIDVVLFFLLHYVRVCVFLSEISNLLMRCKIVIINYNLNL